MCNYGLFVFMLVATTLQAYKIVTDVEYEEAQQWIIYDTVGRYLSKPEMKILNDMDWLPNSNKIGYDTTL